MSLPEEFARQALQSAGMKALGIALDALPELARWLFVPDSAQSSVAQEVRAMLAERSASRDALNEIRNAPAD